MYSLQSVVKKHKPQIARNEEKVFCGGRVLRTKNHLPVPRGAGKTDGKTTIDNNKKGCALSKRLQLRLGRAAHGGTEAFLELVDATFGVHELLLTGEERMGVRGDTDGDQVMLDAIDLFLAVGGFGGACDHAGSGGHINENHGMIIRMKIAFHKDEDRAVPTRRGVNCRNLVKFVKLTAKKCEIS